MTHDIKLHIAKCITCLKVKYNEKNTKMQNKTILSKGPRDRFVADIWYLPPDLNSKFTNYRYVLDIIDHFTKFTNFFFKL